MAASVGVDGFVDDEDTRSISDTSPDDLDASLSSEDSPTTEHILDEWEAGVPIANGGFFRKRYLSALQNQSSETSNVLRRRSYSSGSNTKKTSHGNDHEQNGTYLDGLSLDGRPSDLLFFANGAREDEVTPSGDLDDKTSIPDGRKKDSVSVPKEGDLTVEDATDDLDTEAMSQTKRKPNDEDGCAYVMAKRLRRNHRMFRYEHRYISFGTDIKFGGANPQTPDEDTDGKRVYVFKEHAGTAHREPKPLATTLDIQQDEETTPSRHTDTSRNPITLWDCIWGWVGVLLFALVMLYILGNRTPGDFTERDFSDEAEAIVGAN